MNPRRLRRTKSGSPPGAFVGRPTRFGNPFRYENLEGKLAKLDRKDQRRILVAAFREHRHQFGYPSDDEVRTELRGKNLVCWCPLNEDCHADELLRIANTPDHIGAVLTGR